MFKQARAAYHRERLANHLQRIESLEEVRDRWADAGRKGQVLAANYEVVSNATRALDSVRKLEELVPEIASELENLRSTLAQRTDLPAVPRDALNDKSAAEIDQIFAEWISDADSYRPTKDQARPGDMSDEERWGARLLAAQREYGIPEEILQRKYAAYAVALKASGRTSDWNEDIDRFALANDFLTPQEIQAARTDPHIAILNRIAVALAAEGWL